MATRLKCSPLFALIGFTAVAAGVVAPSRIAGAQVQASAGTLATSQKVWEDRGPIESLDLYWGSASAEREPVGPFVFIREDLNATNPKAKVRDAKGVVWGVKWDGEVQAEVAATRLAWAMGLEVEETYYVESGRIIFPGPRPTFQRIGHYIDKTGNFKSPARFERRGPDLVSKGRWPFAKNPLMADDGYSVLVLMDVVMGNWDAKDSNNKIVWVPDAAGTTARYMVGDYGACFGKMGGSFSHSKYDLRDFERNPPVITSVSGDAVHLAYQGRNASFHASVPREGARLFASMAAHLRLEQVEDAFRAAHANQTDLRGFAHAVYDRMQEVVRKVM